MTYQKDETIEVLSPEGNWILGKYLFPANYFDNFEESDDVHVIECFDLDYYPIRITDDKIRKMNKINTCDETAHYRCLG